MLADDAGMYPNIYYIFKMVCTLPVSTSECERSVSVLKILKTALRNSTGEDRLSSLAILYIHKALPLDHAAAVEEYARRHPRRMELVDSTSHD